MRLLLSSSTLDKRNGYGNITYELSRTLVKKGHEVTLLVPRDSEDEAPNIQGLTVEKVLPPYLFKALHPRLLEYMLWRYRGQKKFDLVHSLFETPYAPLMARESKRMGLPFVMGAQGTYGVKPLSAQPDRFFLKYAYNTAKSIMVPSEYTRNAILKESNEQYPIIIIHNGVDFERFEKEDEASGDIRKRYQGKKILLTVGQLKHRKGQDIVLRALPQILKKHHDTIYLLAGDDGWRGHLQKLTQELGLNQHVVFLGAVPSEEVSKYFHAADVYVHTARVSGKYSFEGFGIVYLEAASCGKPSVGTNAGGITDALLQGKTGYVAEDEDIDQVARYVIELLDDETLRKKMGENGREYARSHTWDRIADEYVGEYKKALS